MNIQGNENNENKYTHGIFSDLQEAWNRLKHTAHQLPYGLRSIFIVPINDGMNWESVRDLYRMHQALTSITILIQQEHLGGILQDDLEALLKIFDEVLTLEEIS